MVKYILQHIGKWNYNSIERKVSKKEIEELINSGLISGNSNITVRFDNKTYQFSDRKVKEMIAEDYIYANKNNEPEAHFFRGLFFGKNISEIENLLSKEDNENLLNIFPNGDLKFWGSKSGVDNRTQRKIYKIEPGDILILVNTFGVEAIGEIAYLVESSNVGLALWDDDDYNNIIFLKNIIMMPKLSENNLKKILGFSQNYDQMSMHIIDYDHKGYCNLSHEVDKLLETK